MLLSILRYSMEYLVKSPFFSKATMKPQCACAKHPGLLSFATGLADSPCTKPPCPIRSRTDPAISPKFHSPRGRHFEKDPVHTAG